MLFSERGLWTMAQGLGLGGAALLGLLRRDTRRTRAN